MSSTTTNTEQLAALVAAKQQVLEILVRLSQRQVEVIDAGDMTLLMKLLAGKHTVMSQLQTIERELAPFRDQDPDQRTWRSPGERTACQARAEQCNTLLAEAMELERRAEAAMLDRRDAAAVALAAIQIGSDAKAAYAAMGPASSASLQVEG
jgi:flagellar biosynthesis/type III secretory pathway chaperone